jgi:dihydrofolate reductase
MSKVRYYCAMSLDGFIAESDDTLDWLLGYDGSYEGADAEGSGYERFYADVGSLVMGSTTYEWILAHVREWPYAGKPAWVLSSRALAPPAGEGADVRIVAAEAPELIDEQRAAAGARDVWVVGGGNVASQFADHGLIDQVEVTVVPVVLGSGKPLFDRRLPGRPLQLLGARALPNGMVELRYEVVAGDLSV